MDMHGSFRRAVALADACDEVLPPVIGQSERRMQARAWAHWAALRNGRDVPATGDLDLAAIPEMAAHAVLFEVAGDAPRVLWLGARLAAVCGIADTPATLAEAPAASVLGRIARRWRQVLANAAPVGFEAETASPGGGMGLHRAILLPLAGADGAIAQVLAVVNSRETAPLAISDALMQELSGVLGNLADAPAQDFAAWLAAAQGAAALADGTGGAAGRQRLYDAIGAAWDLALAAEADPAGLVAALGPTGIVVRADAGFRAPLLAIAKLTFGATRDKTRLTEIATVLGHARRLGLPVGTLADYLRSAPGGLKAVIGEARRQERAARGDSGWRGLPAVALGDLPGEGPGLTLLAARRGARGVEIVGELAGAREVLRRLGKRAQLRGG